MIDIIEYLINPMRKGVYSRIYKINFKSLKDILKDVAVDKNHPDYDEAINMLKNEESLYDEMVEFNFGVCVSYVLFRKPIEEFFILMNVNEKSFNNKVLEYMNDFKISREEATTMCYTDDAINFFDSRIILDIIDVLCVDDITESQEIQEFFKIYDITSIKKDTLLLLETFMKKIPYVGETFEILKERHTFSSRYVYKPYPRALKFWFEHESTIKIPKDLLELLSAASEYHIQNEWRTSVILSAIVLESVLADIFEEEIKESAPDVPLGALYEQVKRSVIIPPDIQSAIESVNRARIAAVHRSKSPVSDRDADIALSGTTKTLMWYAENY